MEPLSLHDHLRLAQTHLTAAISTINLDEAFRLAAFESRITQYGHQVATVDRLRRLIKDLQQVQTNH